AAFSASSGAGGAGAFVAPRCLASAVCADGFGRAAAQRGGGARVRRAVRGPERDSGVGAWSGARACGERAAVEPGSGAGSPGAGGSSGSGWGVVAFAVRDPSPGSGRCVVAGAARGPAFGVRPAGRGCGADRAAAEDDVVPALVGAVVGARERSGDAGGAFVLERGGGARDDAS